MTGSTNDAFLTQDAMHRFKSRAALTKVSWKLINALERNAAGVDGTCYASPATKVEVFSLGCSIHPSTAYAETTAYGRNMSEEAHHPDLAPSGALEMGSTERLLSPQLGDRSVHDNAKSMASPANLASDPSEATPTEQAVHKERLPQPPTKPWRPKNATLQARTVRPDIEAGSGYGMPQILDAGRKKQGKAIGPLDKTDRLLPWSQVTSDDAPAPNVRQSFRAPGPGKVMPHSLDTRKSVRSQYEARAQLHASNRYNLRPKSTPMHAETSRTKLQEQSLVPSDGFGKLTISDISTHSYVGVDPVKRPEPKLEYLDMASQEPQLLPGPQPLLIIFDLNGTLLHRPSRKYLTSFVPRPGLDEFIKWLADEEGVHSHRHRAMVWSSAKPENVNAMVDKLFTPSLRQKLVAVWARDRLGLTPHQYRNKVQVYKELTKVWRDPQIGKSYPGYGYLSASTDGKESWVEEEGWWDQSNTILVDDSILKASSEPHNILQITEFENRPDQSSDHALLDAKEYITKAACYHDVSCFIKRNPFRIAS